MKTNSDVDKLVQSTDFDSVLWRFESSHRCHGKMMELVDMRVLETRAAWYQGSSPYFPTNKEKGEYHETLGYCRLTFRTYKHN